MGPNASWEHDDRNYTALWDATGAEVVGIIPGGFLRAIEEGRPHFTVSLENPEGCKAIRFFWLVPMGMP